jgi:OmpA-OmpF porin, OOP family
VTQGRKALNVIAFLGALAGAPGALAQDAGFYAGGALGQATLTEWCVPAPTVLTCDDKDSAWKLFGGYRFNRNFALEASYVDWGEASGTVSGVGRVSAEQTSMGIAAVGMLDLAPQFSIFGKAGFLLTEQETRGASARKRDDTEFHYGIGARFAFAPKWAARAEWEKTQKLKVELISLGVEYRF